MTREYQAFSAAQQEVRRRWVFKLLRRRAPSRTITFSISQWLSLFLAQAQRWQRYLIPEKADELRMKPLCFSPPEEIRFWRPSGLGGAEFVRASYGRRSFQRHFHEEYSVTMVVRGVERFRQGRRADLAPAGSLILVSPGEVHVKASVDDIGFAYRTLFVPVPVVERSLLETGFRVAARSWLRPPIHSLISEAR